jgi:hypothetical protein
MDGFDLDDLSSRYAQVSGGTVSTTSNARHAGMRCLLIPNNNNPGITVRLNESNETIIVGFAFRATSTFSSDNTNYITFYGDSNSQQHVTVVFDAFNQYIQPKLGTTSGSNIGSGALMHFPTTDWAYYEIKLKIADSPNGSIEIRRDGDPTPIINETSVDTRNGGTVAGVDTVRFGVGNTGGMNIDDFYIANLSGSANNNFLGNVRVARLTVDGNGSSSDFVGSDSDSIDNYDLLQPLSSDYVRGMVGDIDLYSLADLPDTATDIFAVQEVAQIKKGTAGNITAATKIKIGATEYDSSYIGVPPGWFSKTNIRELDPSTSLQWVYSDINNIELGLGVS